MDPLDLEGKVSISRRGSITAMDRIIRRPFILSFRRGWVIISSRCVRESVGAIQENGAVLRTSFPFDPRVKEDQEQRICEGLINGTKILGLSFVPAWRALPQPKRAGNFLAFVWLLPSLQLLIADFGLSNSLSLVGLTLYLSFWIISLIVEFLLMELLPLVNSGKPWKVELELGVPVFSVDFLRPSLELQGVRL